MLDQSADSSANSAAEQEDFTELGAALRMLRHHGIDLRYDHQSGHWYIWNGRYWERDTTAEVWRRAQAAVLSCYAEAAELASDSARDALIKHANKFQSKAKLEAMIKLAGNQQSVVIRPSQLDQDADLLCCESGVIHLPTGEQRPHERRYLQTLCCPVEYDPEIDQSQVVDLVRYFCDGDEELAAWVQRAVGASLYGHNQDEVFMVLSGAAGCGKSTLLAALVKVLGSYAKAADESSFMSERSKSSGGANPDIARLRGCRMVFVDEVDKKNRLSEATIKKLTGRTMITARALFADFIDFEPQFTMWITCNDRPRVRDDDPGLWRRLLNLHVPEHLEISKEKRDPALKDSLLDPQRGGKALFAWAITGARLYHAKGLATPAKVSEDTLSYRTENDPLGEFLQARCVIDLGNSRAYSGQAELRKHYEEHCRETGERYQLSPRELGARLRNLRIKSGTRRISGVPVKCWLGVDVMSPEEKLMWLERRKSLAEAPECNLKPEKTSDPLLSQDDSQHGTLYGLEVTEVTWIREEEERTEKPDGLEPPRCNLKAEKREDEVTGPSADWETW